jgi:hypothetical protein
MYSAAAELAAANPEIYLPLFERIERELLDFEGKQDALSRARAVASHRAVA